MVKDLISITMKTKTSNQGLIDAIKEKSPHGINIVNILSDVLYMGKEAIYRRLRGDVPFNFEEASLISQAMGISLDAISGKTSSYAAMFGLNFIDYHNPVETYRYQNEQLVTMFTLIRNDPTVVWAVACNIIPQIYYLEYESLSRFLLFKWLYQHEKINNVKYFSEVKIDTKLRETQRRYLVTSRESATTYFIWDRMMFYNLLNDIKYFGDISLISKSELATLKKDIYSLLDKLEELALRGSHPSGKKVLIYISNINLEATYSYLEAADLTASFLRVYSINMISTTDKDVFENQKSWIQSLKRYSTLISESGEIQRTQFFKKQREYVKELL